MPVRFAVVGCGNMGVSADQRAAEWPIARWWLPLSHAGAIRATPDAQLVAFSDVDPARLQEARRLHGEAPCYTDYQRMLREVRPDAIAIATRTAERKSVILAALDGGVRGIFCEKPLSNSLEDADEIAKAVIQAGAWFVYGTRRRYMPAYRAVRERAQAGSLGRLSSVILCFGVGKLFWSHPHTADLAAFFATDRPAQYVQADLELEDAALRGQLVDADPVIRSAHIRFEDLSVLVAPANGSDVEVHGSDGIASIRSDGIRIHWRSLNGRSDLGWFVAERSEDPEPVSGTVASIRALCTAILRGVDPGYDVTRAVANQELLFAMVESHLADGARIKLPLQRRGLIISGRSGDRFA